MKRRERKLCVKKKKENKKKNRIKVFDLKINLSYNSFTLRSDEPVPGFSTASPWPTLELEWGRKLYPTSGSRGSSGLMFGLPPSGDLNQPRGPVTSLKEEPLGARAWMQQTDQTKYVNKNNI